MVGGDAPLGEATRALEGIGGVFGGCELRRFSCAVHRWACDDGGPHGDCCIPGGGYGGCVGHFACGAAMVGLPVVGTAPELKTGGGLDGGGPGDQFRPAGLVLAVGGAGPSVLQGGGACELFPGFDITARECKQTNPDVLTEVSK